MNKISRFVTNKSEKKHFKKIIPLLYYSFIYIHFKSGDLNLTNEKKNKNNKLYSRFFFSFSKSDKADEKVNKLI